MAAVVPTVVVPLWPKIAGPTMSPPVEVSYCTAVSPSAPINTNFNRASLPEYFPITTLDGLGRRRDVAVAEEFRTAVAKRCWRRSESATIDPEQLITNTSKSEVTPPRAAPTACPAEAAAGRERDVITAVGTAAGIEVVTAHHGSCPIAAGHTASETRRLRTRHVLTTHDHVRVPGRREVRHARRAGGVRRRWRSGRSGRTARRGR